MAMYNNGFPATYQPLYPAYTPMQVPQQNVAPVQQPVQASVQSGRIWVQGEAGARSYLVAPNNTVELWDSESQTLYLKSADASGMPSIKILDYTYRESSKENVPVSNNVTYATKEDIDAVNGVIESMKKKIEKLTKLMKEDEDE